MECVAEGGVIRAADGTDPDERRLVWRLGEMEWLREIGVFSDLSDAELSDLSRIMQTQN